MSTRRGRRQLEDGRSEPSCFRTEQGHYASCRFFVGTLDELGNAQSRPAHRSHPSGNLALHILRHRFAGRSTQLSQHLRSGRPHFGRAKHRLARNAEREPRSHADTFGETRERGLDAWRSTEKHHIEVRLNDHVPRVASTIREAIGGTKEIQTRVCQREAECTTFEAADIRTAQSDEPVHEKLLQHVAPHAAIDFARIPPIAVVHDTIGVPPQRRRYRLQWVPFSRGMIEKRFEWYEAAGRSEKSLRQRIAQSKRLGRLQVGERKGEEADRARGLVRARWIQIRRRP